jgi:hypothetical protein
MSSPSSGSQCADAPPGGIPPLSSSTVDGKPYLRHPDVEAEILRARSCPPAEWLALAEKRGNGRLSNEALVFLIRRSRKGDRDLFGRLVHELGDRTVRIAERWAQGFDQDTLEEIVWTVEKQIVDLVLAETSSRQSDFLEVAFGKAVERRTINAVEKRRNSPLPLRHMPASVSDEETEPERPTELVADERAGPEEIVAELESEAQRPELIRKARAAVKDPRHVEAVILRYVYGWPMVDKDPNKPTLTRHFGKSARQIQNWLADALEAMRAAIGDRK